MEPRQSDNMLQIEKSMVERVEWALEIVTEQDDFTRSILEDLQSSMQAVWPDPFLASSFDFSHVVDS